MGLKGQDWLCGGGAQASWTSAGMWVHRGKGHPWAGAGGEEKRRKPSGFGGAVGGGLARALTQKGD